MGKEKTWESGSSMHFLQSLLRTDIYKRSQGRMTRQVTCIAIWAIFILGAWRLFSIMPEAEPWFKYAVPGVLLLAGLWIGYRAVNDPTFADFLIAVEAEMNKVSWPTQTELVRASIVVIVLIFGLTVVLYTYDVVLSWFFTYVLGITV
jgi:preprotein translocase subunit SecE